MITANRTRTTTAGIALLCAALVTSAGSQAGPVGFVQTTIPLDAPPAGLAFAGDGTLFALEGAAFGSNVATLRSILPDGTFGDSFSIRSVYDGGENGNFFVGSMTYDPVGDRLLISDNTAEGRLYSVDRAGNQQTIATPIAGIAGVAVRETGEIFVSTAPFGSDGQVLLIDPGTKTYTPVLSGLGFGAGLAFDQSNHLIVQDADLTSFLGRLQRLPITDSPSGLQFGSPQPILNGMQSSAGVAVDSEDDIFTTGTGGLYTLAGTPPMEVPFDNNGNAGQFATAIAFDAGTSEFAPFAGPDGGRLAYMADLGAGSVNTFVTLLSPAEPGDYNGDGETDGADYALWVETYGVTDNPAADGNLDGGTNAADYVMWRKFTSGVQNQAELQPSFAVPEPQFALSICAVAMILSPAARRPRLRWTEC